MELDLIKVQWNVKDYAVDFIIPSKYDHIVLKHKEEIIDKLEFLTDALKNGIYPFGNIRGLGKSEEYAKSVYTQGFAPLKMEVNNAGTKG